MKTPAKERLEKLIGKANVDTYLRFYQSLKDINIDTRLKLAQTIFVDAKGKVEEGLSLLANRDLLSQDDIDVIWTYIVRRMIMHKNAIDSVKAIAGLALREFGRGNKPQDENRLRNVLIYVLVHDCKVKTGKLQFHAVCDFLCEQQICDLTYKDIQKIYNKTSEDYVLRALHVYDLFLDTPVGKPFAPNSLPKGYDGFLNNIYTAE